MIVSPSWAGRRYAVLGLARSGAATVAALVAGGAEVVAWDSDEAKRAPYLPGPGRGTAGEAGGGGVSAASAAPVALPLHHQPAAGGPPPRAGEVLIADLEAEDLAGFDALVVSPGVPLNTHPLAAKARAAGVPIIGDIELFAEARPSLPPHRVVGITGTNGKSTTTALVHHILQTAGVPSLMGGNIGLPILAQEPLPEGGVYVLELSSYQIDLTRSLDCDVAVLLNVTPDHLDRYNGFDAYAASKARLFAMSSGTAVIATDGETTRRIAHSLRYAGLDPASIEPQAPPLGERWTPEHVRGDVVEVARSSDPKSIFWSSANSLGDDLAEFTSDRRWPALQGPHNLQNAACASAACWALGTISLQVIATGLETFTGLPHRMERVATLDGVTWVDDSKATNPESAAPALAAFPRVHWIVGGRAKGDDLDACAPHFGHLVRAYAIGEAGPRFAAVLRAAGVQVADCGTLAVAVNAAWSAARRGETVLLSPACASFDQFNDYAARGEAFRRAVEALPVKEPTL